MRIVYYLQVLDSRVGGPARTTIDTATALAKAGHDVTLLTQEVGDAGVGEGSLGSGSLKIGLVPAASLPAEAMAPGAARAVDPHLERADALHVLGAFSYANVQVCRRARRLGVPYYVSLAGMLDDDCFVHAPAKKRAYMALVGSRWLRSSAGVHCTAGDELAESSRFFPRDLGYVIPTFVDLEPYRGLPGPGLAQKKYPFLDGAEPAVTFLGRLHPIKGLEMLIDVAGELRARGERMHLVLAGPGDEAYVRSLQAHAITRRVADRVHFTGSVGGALKTSLLQASRVTVSTSQHENFGIALLEGMLSGAPAVTTDRVKIWRELRSSGGATITHRTPSGIAEALLPWLHSPARARAAGEAAREWALEFLDPRRLTGQYEAMYASARRAPVLSLTAAA